MRPGSQRTVTAVRAVGQAEETASASALLDLGSGYDQDFAALGERAGQKAVYGG